MSAGSLPKAYPLAQKAPPHPTSSHAHPSPQHPQHHSHSQSKAAAANPSASGAAAAAGSAFATNMAAASANVGNNDGSPFQSPLQSPTLGFLHAPTSPGDLKLSAMVAAPSSVDRGTVTAALTAFFNAELSETKLTRKLILSAMHQSLVCADLAWATEEYDVYEEGVAVERQINAMPPAGFVRELVQRLTPLLIHPSECEDALTRYRLLTRFATDNIHDSQWLLTIALDAATSPTGVANPSAVVPAGASATVAIAAALAAGAAAASASASGAAQPAASPSMSLFGGSSSSSSVLAASASQSLMRSGSSAGAAAAAASAVTAAAAGTDGGLPAPSMADGMNLLLKAFMREQMKLLPLQSLHNILQTIRHSTLPLKGEVRKHIESSKFVIAPCWCQAALCSYPHTNRLR